MALPPVLERLKLPVIGAPMFIAGNPKLVIEQCKAGIVGSFPALNARPREALDPWLTEIEQALAGLTASTDSSWWSTVGNGIQSAGGNTGSP